MNKPTESAWVNEQMNFKPSYNPELLKYFAWDVKPVPVKVVNGKERER